MSVIRTPLSGRSPVGNALFPRRERSVPMLGTPPKVPLLPLENAAGTGRKRYWSNFNPLTIANENSAFFASIFYKNC